jgi:hypothetical protein
MENLFALAFFGLAISSVSHAAVVVKDVTYKEGDTTYKGVLAYDDAMKEKRPGMIVVHEWWGITQHVRDYTKELAAKGYTALAVDMYGNGKTADNPKDAGELSGSVMNNPDVMKARFDAGKKFLLSQPTVDPKRVGALGFCFGGGVVLNMARMGEDLPGVGELPRQPRHEESRAARRREVEDAGDERRRRPVREARGDRRLQEGDGRGEGELQVHQLPGRGARLHQPGGDRQGPAIQAAARVQQGCRREVEGRDAQVLLGDFRQTVIGSPPARDDTIRTLPPS